MTTEEAKRQQARLALYKGLEDALEKARAATIQLDNAAFTGNTRESRSVVELGIRFSATLGGAPECDLTIGPISIPAYDFAQFLREALRLRIERIKTEMDKL